MENNTIKNLFGDGYKQRIAVYIPSTVNAVENSGELAEQITNRAAEKMSVLFGGATIQPAEGSWISDEHGYIKESVNIVYSYTDEQKLEQFAADVHALAVYVRDVMKQEAVSVEINNALYFV